MTGFPLQTVFLLGDNYANDESLSDLFLNFLAKNISTIFTPIDYRISHPSLVDDPRWRMPDESVSLARYLSTAVRTLPTGEEEEEFDSLGCFWGNRFDDDSRIHEPEKIYQSLEGIDGDMVYGLSLESHHE